VPSRHTILEALHPELQRASSSFQVEQAVGRFHGSFRKKSFGMTSRAAFGAAIKMLFKLRGQAAR